MDCSPPGSSIHGSFQARVLEWGSRAFSEEISKQKHPEYWRLCNITDSTAEVQWQGKIMEQYLLLMKDEYITTDYVTLVWIPIPTNHEQFFGENWGNLLMDWAL